MAYRIECAETPEQKAKETAFTGLGLTSRKNLCLHPEVPLVPRIVALLLFNDYRYPRRRKALWLTRVVVI